MTDIVEQLRTLLPIIGVDKGLMVDAAAEIERLHKIELQFDALKEERVRWFADNEWLTADNERLRAVLREIEHETGMTMLATNHGRRGDLANTIARAALEPKP